MNKDGLDIGTEDLYIRIVKHGIFLIHGYLVDLNQFT